MVGLMKIASNMHELEFENGDAVLFSYATPVAAVIGPSWYITDEWHSATTSRHINKWLDYHGKERRILVPVPQSRLDSMLMLNK